MRHIALILMLLSALAASAVSPFVGTWHGELDLGMQKLPVVIHISDNGASIGATMDSPLQGAYGIPATASEADSTLTVAITALGAQYKGSMSDGEIKGTFSQNGFSLPLTLVAGDYIPERPRTPKPPFPYSTSDVTFTNPKDGAVLSGTLTMPLNTTFRGKKNPVPVVLMVSGSGQQNRDEELFGHKPFAVLAHNLALHGIASLRYDDRGFGKSTGSLDGATTATFAADAAAGLDYVNSKKDLFSKVGILGHSEGGTIAYMLAAEQQPDFIVSIAGPTVAGDKLLLAQNEALLDALGYSPERLSDYLTGLQRVFDYLKLNPKAEEWTQLEASCSDLSNLQPKDIENYKAIIKESNPWLIWFICHNPSSDIAKTTIPVMAIFGDKDMQVPASLNAEALQTTLKENEKSIIKTYPGLNHLMQNAVTGLPSEYPQISETFSPEVIDDICKWIKSL